MRKVLTVVGACGFFEGTSKKKQTPLVCGIFYFLGSVVLKKSVQIITMPQFCLEKDRGFLIGIRKDFQSAKIETTRATLLLKLGLLPSRKIKSAFKLYAFLAVLAVLAGKFANFVMIRSRLS